MNMEGLRSNDRNQINPHMHNLKKSITKEQNFGFASLPNDFVIKSQLNKENDLVIKSQLNREQVDRLSPITTEEVLTSLTTERTENLHLTVQSIAGQLFSGAVTPKKAAKLLVEQSKLHNIPIKEVRDLSMHYVKQHPYKTSLETGETLNVRKAIEKHQQNVDAERLRQLQVDQGFSKKSQANDTITSADFSGNILGQSLESLWQQAIGKYSREVYAARAYPTSLETGKTLDMTEAIRNHQQAIEVDEKFSGKSNDNSVENKKEDEDPSNENSVIPSHQQMGGALSKLASTFYPGSTGYDGSSSTSSTQEGGSPSSSSHEKHEQHHEKHHHQHYRHMFPTGWFLRRGDSFEAFVKRRSESRHDESRHDESRHKLEGLASQLGLENLAEFLGVRENSGAPKSSKDWEDLDEPIERLLERMKEIREHTSGMPGQKLGVLDTLKHMLGLKLDHLPDFVATPDGTTLPITDAKAAKLGKEFMIEHIINDFKTARSLLKRLYSALEESGVPIDWEYNKPHDETYVGKDIIGRHGLAMRMSSSMGSYTLQAFENLLVDRRESPPTPVGSDLDKCIFRLSAAIGSDFEKNVATNLNDMMNVKKPYVYAGTLNDAGAACVLVASIKAMNMKNKLLRIFLSNINKIEKLQSTPSPENTERLNRLTQRYQNFESYVSQAEKNGTLEIEEVIKRFAKLSGDKK